MSNMYLRNKKYGFIYEWSEILAKNPLCEPVTEEEAFPERFVDQKQIKRVQKKQKETNTKLDLSTDDIPEETPYTAPEIEADASRYLPE